MRYLTGKSKVEELDATTAYCLLNLRAAQLPVDVKLKAKIEHVDLVKFLELKNGEHFIEFDKLVDEVQNIRVEMMK